MDEKTPKACNHAISAPIPQKGNVVCGCSCRSFLPGLNQRDQTLAGQNASVFAVVGPSDYSRRRQ